ncbi:MAG TPA: succinylglutamate desuccinylase/aspartoacylase family protein [Candidatus Methylomirabilis sp.]|nr:succinylglutamate desuccinylase/aspartoacylase family protein [Candidatus Methylomirabilis sp.]
MITGTTTIRVGTAEAAGTGVTRGELRVGDAPDGEAITIPVAIVRGASDGPVLWLHGCVHGDEYCGAFIIHEALRAIDPARLAGAVVALPMLNITASQRGQRMSPFATFGHGDLNRCFPGSPDGAFTDQMAYAIYEGLRRWADYFIDFHTAFTPDTRWALFANAPGEVGRKSEGLARAFGLKSTLPAPMDILGGSAMIAAARDGIPSLIVEMGGLGPAFEAETVREGAERLRNVLRHLRMLPEPPKEHGPLTYFSNFAWVSATRGGLFEPAVRCGERLDKGSLIGRYTSAHGDILEEVASPHAGVVLAMHPGPAMATGEVLVHIGLDPREV